MFATSTCIGVHEPVRRSGASRRSVVCSLSPRYTSSLASRWGKVDSQAAPRAAQPKVLVVQLRVRHCDVPIALRLDSVNQEVDSR